jgi:hypothetical protein
MIGKRLLDADVSCLIYYSVSLMIFGGMSFFSDSFDNTQELYDRRWRSFSTFLGLVAGSLGAVQGCARNQVLALIQMFAIGLCIVLTLFLEYFTFISNALSLFAVWGVEPISAFVYLWVLTYQVVVFFYLGLGIVFAHRVWVGLGRSKELETRLI